MTESDRQTEFLRRHNERMAHVEKELQAIRDHRVPSELEKVVRQVLDREDATPLPLWARNWLEDALRHLNDARS